MAHKMPFDKEAYSSIIISKENFESLICKTLFWCGGGGGERNLAMVLAAVVRETTSGPLQT